MLIDDSCIHLESPPYHELPEVSAQTVDDDVSVAEGIPHFQVYRCVHDVVTDDLVLLYLYCAFIQIWPWYDWSDSVDAGGRLQPSSLPRLRSKEGHTRQRPGTHQAPCYSGKQQGMTGRVRFACVCV